MNQNKFAYLSIVSIAILCFSCKTTEKQEQQAGTIPYTIQLQEYVNPKLPDLHSYTHAIYNDKIVMIGGRTNGLHGGQYNFIQTFSNKNIYVVDTKKWSDPTAWDVYSIPDTKLVVPSVNLEQFRANNAEFFTQDSVLYIIGGMLNANVPTALKDTQNIKAGVGLVAGAKSSNGAAPTGPKTLAYMTAINLPGLINKVMYDSALATNDIRQVHDTSLAVTGGEVSVMNNKVYLAFGWNFYFTTPPTPQDLYTHQIRSFTFNDDGKTFTISGINVCNSCTDNYASNANDSGNFRRRDGSMSAFIDPANESQSLMYYSGVFKNGVTNFDSPIWIGTDSAAEQDFVMRSNVYTCQVIPVYSKSNKVFYASMLGGMKNANFTGDISKLPVQLKDSNAPLIPTDSKNPFSHIPFSNQITTVTVNAQHQFAQYLLPDSFPKTMVPYTLPFVPGNPAKKIAPVPAQTLPAGSVTFNGAESEMHWTLNTSLYPNGVIDYDAFIKANPSGGSVGYLHGGIQSVLLNVFGTNAPHYSIASNRIFAVKIVPIAQK